MSPKKKGIWSLIALFWLSLSKLIWYKTLTVWHENEILTAAKICLEDATNEPLINPSAERQTKIDITHEYEPIIFSTAI